MKIIPSARPIAAALILATAFAAAPSEALWPFGGSEPVQQKEIKERAHRQFDQLVREINKNNDLGKDAKELAVSHVHATEAKFDERAAELKKPQYESWEFDFLGERVIKVIIPTIKQAVAAAAVVPMQNQAAALEAAVQDNAPKDAALIQEFASGVHRSSIIRTMATIAANPEPGSDAAASPGGTAGGQNKPAFDPEHVTPEQIEEAVKNSEVVQLAVNVANDVVNSVPPPPVTPEPGTGLPLPAPGVGTGGGLPVPVPGGGATAPNQPAQGGSRGSRRGSGTIGDVIKRIASPGGVSQLYASSGVSALESRDYRKAFELAGRALALDPKNRNGLEVLHAVKGRGDAIGAGAAGLKAANAGAFAPSGFGGSGPSGGASPSPEIAAAAAAGAARVAADQARGGAMNALKLGDAGGALEILSKALKQDPNNPALLNLRAQTYGRLGRWEEALKDAAAGLALVPGNMALLNTQALAQNRTHRYREALATSEEMIAADPRSAWGYANRAHAWGGLGNREEMLAGINRAAALDPIFQRAAADAARLQLPSDADVMFLFPGEAAKGTQAAPAASAGRGKSFGLVVGAGLFGGLLLALGLLSTVLAPLKNTVVSVFTRAKRTGPETNPAIATAQPASVAGNVGGLIRGQYEISRQIGAGGMGMVYEGTDRSLGRRVAIKKMRDELRLNARERDRFIIEAKTVASLHHPNIVDIYAIAEEGEDVYLVFEYVDGKTVHDLVQLKGRLDPAEATRVTRAMGDALTYAHSRGVIHRDMKPSNVMVTSSGQVKVMDFGIARMAKDALTRYSVTNTVVGTPPYMAPEQEQGVVRKESDVYALAICSYEMLTGKLPFIGMGAGMLMNKINMSYIPPSRNIAGLPEALDAVFLKAFQADPDRRYRTPQEFVAALSAVAEGTRSPSKPA